MDEHVLAAVEDQEAYVVGGAVRDELLGRAVVDLDVACADPEGAARAYAEASGGAVFPLSERHRAWRVAFRDDRTVDFTPLPDGLEADLASRDFTFNAIARRVDSSELIDPHGGRADLERGLVRAVGEGVFRNDPLRLLRAVRFEDELGFRLDSKTESLVRRDAALVGRPAGERVLAELLRLSAAGYRRLDELGVLGRLNARAPDGEVPLDSPEFRLVWFLREQAESLPLSNQLRRYVRTLLRARPPVHLSPRAVYRFRRSTEPWAVDALVFAGGPDGALDLVREQRAAEPEAPLLRGDELGLPEGPEVGRILDLIAEERAVGSIQTREEALELARREGASPQRG